MAFDQEVGTQKVRSQFVDGMVKQIAARSYKFKQALTISSTSAWKNFFFRENTNVLTGQSGNLTSGLPRGAEFPQAVATWDKIQANIVKYGLEANIHWEDIISNDIDVQNRTIIKITEGVVKSVDDDIWNVLTESQTATASAVQDVTTFARWDESSAAIIDDLMQAKQKIAEKNYPVDNLMCFISPKDHRRIVKWITDKGAQFPSFSTDAAVNGSAGNLAGINLVISNSVTASWALVVVPQRCGTWKELYPLSTTTKTDEYKSVTIRAVELGITELTDPLAVVRLKNTQAA